MSVDVRKHESGSTVEVVGGGNNSGVKGVKSLV